MPNIKSAIKRVKVSETKNLQNRIVKTKVKTAVIDKAVTKGVIHKNAANRKKARLAKRLAKAQ